jgi:arsenical pump membrane protein
VLRDHQLAPKLGDFVRLGALTVPGTIGVAVIALWAMLRTVGS